MRQVLFEIPVPVIGARIPVFGYGAMLVVAILTCTWWVARRADRVGADGQMIGELTWWLLLPGLLGARLFYVTQYREQFEHWYEFFFLWQGGLVIYGGALGALLGFLVFAYRRNLPRLWLLDLIAPALALGMALGRLGCLLNGCCFGGYCSAPWAISFPPGSPPQQRFASRGDQARLGFLVGDQERRVLLVEPGTPAHRAGLRAGDEIVAVDGQPADSASRLHELLLAAGLTPRQRAELPFESGIAYSAKAPFSLTIQRKGQVRSIDLVPAASLPVHPTQIYSSIDGLVIFCFLAALYPLRRHDGEVIAWFAMLYAISRFLIEFLRSDEPALFDGLTISQNVSLLLFVTGLVTWLWVLRQPPRMARP